MLLWNRFGFVNQHDRDPVSNLIEELAMPADQAVFRFIQKNGALTFWARQNIKQFLVNGHLNLDFTAY